jgi:hypothetical protein
MLNAGPVHEPRDNGGSAARFFNVSNWSDEEWLVQNHLLSHADAAALPSCPSSVLDAIVQSDVVISLLPADRRLSVVRAPSTSVTPTELKRLAEALITAIQSIAAESWREWPPTGLIVRAPHATCAAHRTATGITLTIHNPLLSSDSVAPVTFNITPANLEAGAQDSAERFKYCAKASKADRDEGLDAFDPQAFVQFQTGNGESGKASSLSDGRETQYRNTHPTVKPTALMRYLVRLVTPVGGTVLDPFTGSGSTGKAAVLEGRSFIGCELTEAYVPIARARIAAALNKAYPTPTPAPLADMVIPMSAAQSDLFGEAA